MIKILPHESIDVLSKYIDILKEVDVVKYIGKVERVVGLTIESNGPPVQYGDLCLIRIENKKSLSAEVVGFHRNRVILMPVGDMKGVVAGAEVIPVGSSLMVQVGDELLGRVLSGTGEPLDGKGMISSKKKYPVITQPVNPLERRIIDKPLPVGIRAIDAFLTAGKGQRMGIFSGSGVGKSLLLGMIARNTEADVNVIALIGERGREVRNFIEKELGTEGLKKSVVVVATSDQPPMVRLRGAFVAHAIAEYFRDEGLDVNLLMDSVTRFAMAQREIGLAIGEPSATRGYPPSVFSLLPRLLERSGSRVDGGSITGFYSILVDSDDMNEPISDAVRGILDGHIVLERKLANKGHYPAIDILASLSRCMRDVVSTEHFNAANQFRGYLSAYIEAEDLISLGGYAKGSDPIVDKALEMIDGMNLFLRQGINEIDTFENTVKGLISLFNNEERLGGETRGNIVMESMSRMRTR